MSSQSIRSTAIGRPGSLRAFALTDLESIDARCAIVVEKTATRSSSARPHWPVEVKKRFEDACGRGRPWPVVRSITFNHHFDLPVIVK